MISYVDLFRFTYDNIKALAKLFIVYGLIGLSMGLNLGCGMVLVREDFGSW